MRPILLTLFLSVLIIAQSWAQDYPKTRYLNVQSDKNIRKNADPKLCISCSDKIYIVDGDESFGYVELEFNGINICGPVTTIELLINTSEVKYAESANGLGVFFNDEHIGGVEKIGGNCCQAIKLNASKIAGSKDIKLILKANGGDGIYMLSKSSGFGAILKLQY